MYSVHELIFGDCGAEPHTSTKHEEKINLCEKMQKLITSKLAC